MSQEAEEIWKHELCRVQKKQAERECTVNNLGKTLVTYAICAGLFTFVGGAVGIFELIRGTSFEGTADQIARAKFAAVVAGTGAISSALFTVAAILLVQWCKRERRRTAKWIQDLEAGLEAERKLTAQNDLIVIDDPLPPMSPEERVEHIRWMTTRWEEMERRVRRGQTPPVGDEDHPRSA